MGLTIIPVQLRQIFKDNRRAEKENISNYINAIYAKPLLHQAAYNDILTNRILADALRVLPLI